MKKPSLWSTGLGLLFVFITGRVERLGAQDYSDEHEFRRIALVMGNPVYDSLAALPSASADADSVARKLRQRGFIVDTVESLKSVADFENRVLPGFRSKLQPGDIVVVYFSGHGFSVGGHNWLAPVDMPLSVAESRVPDVAISIENIGSYLAKKKPTFILFISDACRSIPSFDVVDSEGGSKLDRGVQQTPLEARVDNLVAYAAGAGKFAQASSFPGRLSLFTDRLLAHIDSVDIDFEGLFPAVKSDVYGRFGEQVPFLAPDAFSKLYMNLSPSSPVLKQESEFWSLALSEPGAREKVSSYSRVYATSRHAIAAQRWLSAHPDSSSNRYTYASAADIEHAWNPAAQVITVASLGVPLAFPRAINVNARPQVLSSRVALGKKEGVTSSAQKVNADIVTARAHGTLITTGDLIARAAPDRAGSVATRIDSGTAIVLGDRAVTTKEGMWVQARPVASDSTLYVRLGIDSSRPQQVILGKALVEFLVPEDTTHVLGAIDSKFIGDVLRKLRGAGKDIRWVSLAARSATDNASSDVARIMVMQAEDAVIRAGVDSKRITAVLGAADVRPNTIRVRVFGWEP